VFHVVEHQAERMFKSAEYPYEWYDVPVREEVVCVCFPVESPGVICSIHETSTRNPRDVHGDNILVIGCVPGNVSMLR